MDKKWLSAITLIFSFLLTSWSAQAQYTLNPEAAAGGAVVINKPESNLLIVEMHEPTATGNKLFHYPAEIPGKSDVDEIETSSEKQKVRSNISTAYKLYTILPLKYTSHEKTQETITGVVTDFESGEPLAGVNISVKGTTRGTTTDGDGRYSLTVEDLQAVLVFSFIGYQVQEVQIQGRTSISISLTSEVSKLGDLVVVGYGVQRKGTVTSSISQVTTEEISGIPVTSADELLQGRMPGVDVNSSSGVPGSGLAIKVRGTSSISGDGSPLYVIDGVPIVSGEYGLSVGGGTTNSNVFLNSNDIASITILKDAASASIYGARASNGVVLIETKSGRNKPQQINFSTQIGFKKAIKEFSDIMTNGVEFEKLMNESRVLNGQPILYPNPDAATNTNWSDMAFRTGAFQNYNLSYSRNFGNTSYHISGSYLFDKAPLNPLSLNRSTLLTKINTDLWKDVSVDVNLNLSSTIRNRRQNDNGGGILGGVMWFPPNLPVYQPDGDFTRCCLDDNPLPTIYNQYHIMDTDRLLGSINLSYNFMPELVGNMMWSYDRSNNNEDVYFDTKTQSGSTVGGRGIYANSRITNWIGQFTVNYIKDIDNNHLDLLVGTSIDENTLESSSITAIGFPNDNVRRLNDASEVIEAISSANQRDLISFFSRLQYDYDARYMATLSIRRDGSSRFGVNNKWGVFPSFGLGWNIAREPFYKIDKINELKLRASYGITGNQEGISDFASHGLWESMNYGNQSGLIYSQLSNPNLKWESTRQFNVGLDVGIMNGFISFTGEYYSNYTYDLLLQKPVPYSSGFDVVYENIGEVSNKGLEFSLESNLINKRDFNWRTQFNISGNRNKIEKLAEPFIAGIRDIFRYEEGLPMYSFYFHKQLGVDPATGDVSYLDADGDGVFNPSTDRTIVGKADPDFAGGFANYLSYKQFDLSFFFSYKYGNKQANINRYFAESGGTRNQNFTKTQLNRWQNPGDKTDIPKMTVTNYNPGILSSRFVEDASYLRLDNITLGYRLAPEFLNRLGLSEASFYVSGKNLLLFTKYSGLDPEITESAVDPLTKGVEFLSVPHSKELLFGINLSF